MTLTVSASRACTPRRTFRRSNPYP
jgi:hypothetical protein